MKGFCPIAHPCFNNTSVKQLHSVLQSEIEDSFTTHIKVFWGSVHKIFIRWIQPVKDYCICSFRVKLQLPLRISHCTEKQFTLILYLKKHIQYSAVIPEYVLQYKNGNMTGDNKSIWNNLYWPLINKNATVCLDELNRAHQLRSFAYGHCWNPVCTGAGKWQAGPSHTE